MKKFALLIISLFILSFFSQAFADDAPLDDSNWGVHQETQDEQAAEETSPSEEAWNEVHDTIIYDKYGSEYSPAFLNREMMNPNEADYEYGSADGVE